MSDQKEQGHAPLWEAINGLRERAATLEANRNADVDTVTRLERRIARVEMAFIAGGVAAILVVWQLIAQNAGIPT